MGEPTGTPLIRVRLSVQQDIFTVRQLGREVARLVGLEGQDETRLATALSEVARVMVAEGRTATVTFSARTDPVPALAVEMALNGTVPLAEQVAVVGRLVDTLEVKDAQAGTVVEMSRRLPSGAQWPTTERMAEMRAQLEQHRPGTPLDELAVQNQQLIAALDEVRAQRDDLARLNAELEETNKGVMALYHQLSEELEETNKGVVALYAELDDRSAQLRAASEAKTRFLANVSHELRAPVTAIIGLGRLLTAESSDPLTGEQQRQVDLIRGSATDLLTLVNDLLDLAKAEAGRLEPTPAEVDLRAVFGQLRGTLRPLATRPEVDFVVEEPGLATIRTDEALLVQILRNLLTNAIKFTATGSVRMRVTRSGEDAVFEVADTGAGIPPELHERIFEEFYQVPGSPALSGKGTGLGLPYARRLAGILGGALRVESEPGKGSTFTVVLPAGVS